MAQGRGPARRPDYAERYDTWISWFDEEGIEAVGFGWLNLRRTDRDQPVLRLEEWPFDVEQPLGSPGAEVHEQIVLRQQRGLRRARQVDTVEAGLVGACDADLSVGQILGALGSLLERDVEEVRAPYLPAVRDLVDEGFLEVSTGGS